MSSSYDDGGRRHKGDYRGLKIGFVKENVGKKGVGDVLLTMPTEPEGPETDYIRNSSPYASKGTGWMSLPEVGSEVLFGYANGDPEMGVVLGGMHNGVDLPPWTDPAIQGFRSRAGHQVIFDNTEGAERIEMTVGNETIKLVWDQVEKTMSVFCEGDIVIEAAETVTMKCKDFILNAEENISIHANEKIEITSTEAAVDGGQHLTLKADLTEINPHK